MIDVADVELLDGSIRTRSNDERFDLNADGQVNSLDQDVMITEVLGTTRGDANLDGVFDEVDLIRVLQTAQFDDGVTGNSSWQTGDWNSDGDFNAQDIVLALQDGGWRSRPI